jgi:hypothetical protein
LFGREYWKRGKEAKRERWDLEISFLLGIAQLPLHCTYIVRIVAEQNKILRANAKLILKKKKCKLFSLLKCDPSVNFLRNLSFGQKES